MYYVGLSNLHTKCDDIDLFGFSNVVVHKLMYLFVNVAV
jgi:hypothetical protein